MNHFKHGLLLLLVIFFSGCAVPQKMYYWGDYSKTSYQMKKHPSEQTSLEHQQSLENIIAESAKNNLRVPPGVYAELGYVYFRQNRKDEAIRYFESERKLYPESSLLMERLEKAINLADKPDHSVKGNAVSATEMQITPDKQVK